MLMVGRKGGQGQFRLCLEDQWEDEWLVQRTVTHTEKAPVVQNKYHCNKHQLNSVILSTNNPGSFCYYFWTKGALRLTSHLCSDGFILSHYLKLVWPLSLQIWFTSAKKLFSQYKFLIFAVSPWWCYYQQYFCFSKIGMYGVLLGGVLKGVWPWSWI